MTPNFEAMARPGWTNPAIGPCAEDMMAARLPGEFWSLSTMYDQLDRAHFSGSPISPAGDRWDNRRKPRPGGQYTLIV